ncbi:MAG: hypothetical protein JRI68_01750 [Deltaproteobacteria bacterium]|nr:hypothetical protein [Deltaproteobacteria bacterium]
MPRNKAPAPRTVVVLGVPRGGTSVVAGVLRHLGIYMGVGLTEHYEDWAFYVTLRGGLTPRDLKVNRLLVDHLKDTIFARNQAHTLWGWKRPGTVTYLDRIETQLRNPCYLVPVRGLVDVALSTQRHSGHDPARTLQRGARQYQQIFSVVASGDRSALLFDYDSALEHREQFVARLVDFIGLQPDGEQLAAATAFVKPGEGYQPPHRAGISGVVDQVEPQRVRGWACDRGAPEQAIELCLLLDGQERAVVTANLPRGDVAAAGKHPTGRCGFRIALPPSQAIAPGQEVRVVDSAHCIDLVKSGMLYRPGLWELIPGGEARGAGWLGGTDTWRRALASLWQRTKASG